MAQCHGRWLIDEIESSTASPLQKPIIRLSFYRWIIMRVLPPANRVLWANMGVLDDLTRGRWFRHRCLPEVWRAQQEGTLVSSVANIVILSYFRIVW